MRILARSVEGVGWRCSPPNPPICTCLTLAGPPPTPHAGPIVVFIAGLSATAAKFGYFFAITWSMSICMAAFFRMLAYVMPSSEVAVVCPHAYALLLLATLRGGGVYPTCLQPDSCLAFHSTTSDRLLSLYSRTLTFLRCSGAGQRLGWADAGADDVGAVD